MLRTRAASARLLALTLFAGPAPGAPEPEPHRLADEDLYFEDVPVVLSVTRLAQPMSETPGSVTLIDREMIEASGAREIPELLRLVPGFQVASENGSFHTVTYHGLSDQFSRRMQVLVDGRSVYTLGVGQVEWTALPLAIDDIERIEVVRGPNASAYGANAFLGVISITTRHAAEARPGPYLRVTRGTNDVKEGLVRHAGTYGPVSLRATMAHRADDGFDDRNDAKQVRLATLRADYALTVHDAIEAQVGYNEGNRQDGFADEAGAPFFIQQPRTKEELGTFALLRWRHLFDPGNELQLQAYVNRFARRDTLGAGAFLPADARTVQQRYDAELQHNLGAPGEPWRLVWGASARLDRSYGPLFSGGFGDTLHNRTHRAFGNLELRVTPRVLVNLGILWENNDITGTDWSPRLALNFHLNPHVTLRASLTRALRTPSFFENNADWRQPVAPPLDQVVGAEVPLFLGPGNLEPEEILSREMGLRVELPGRRLTLDMKAFHDSLFRLIDTTTARPLSFRNEDSASVSGLEGQLRWRPSARSRIILSQSIAQTESRDADLSQSTPSSTTGLLGIYRFSERLSTSVNATRVSAMRWLGEGARVPSYRRLDLRLAYDFGSGGTDARIAVVLQNVLASYVDFRPENVHDNRAFVTLSLGL